MKSWPAKAFLLAGVSALLVALPALGQERESPESLLPPGFGDPQTLPPPAERPKAEPRPQGNNAAPATAPSPGTVAPPPAAPIEGGAEIAAQPGDVEQVELEQQVAARPLNYFSIPEGAGRPVDAVGMLDPGNFGLGAAAFANGNGGFLASLMRRLDAPLPSRWTSILLRRALLSRAPAPAGVDPVNWVAERAALLLQMGEADGARMLVQAVDVDRYTPRMVEVAAQTALATADPSGLCPLIAPARTWSNDSVWILADGMCAALEGEAARAGALIDQARGEGGAGIDLRLAEKVVGAGAETRRAVTIEWEEVDSVTPWRFGLASATGVAIPAPLMNRAGPRIQAWMARAPMVPLDQRLAAAWVAARLGVFSSHSLVEIYSLILDQTDPAEAAGTVGARLRSAWIERDPAARMAALRQLWTEGEAPREAYARAILTAGAAGRIPPSDAFAADSGNLIAAMFSAGMDREAARWGPVVEQTGESDRAWAMLAVGTERPAVTIDSGRIDDFVSADDTRGQIRSRLLVAALAALGRIDEAQAASAGFTLGPGDRWTEAIEEAARARAPGTVALLAGVGMQTENWTGMPPQYLFRIIVALRAVGMEYEARMIAAEAMARL
jgi:hypothetical protein